MLIKYIYDKVSNFNSSNFQRNTIVYAKILLKKNFLVQKNKISFFFFDKFTVHSLFGRNNEQLLAHAYLISLYRNNLIAYLKFQISISFAILEIIKRRKEN